MGTRTPLAIGTIITAALALIALIISIASDHWVDGEVVSLFLSYKFVLLSDQNSSGSSGPVRGGGKKQEIYVAACGGHLFYDLFLQGREGVMELEVDNIIQLCVFTKKLVCTFLSSAENSV